ncbi:pyridoxal phosphate-dependent aminotransferase [Pseudoflavonifractor sp. 60]|uniref:MalY/PatB family protein n=1 Tax=Pseudoflavonifractor sp. 60 TaxID=2304576 RepID=UPI001370720E|nr:MalY/PatB family protein [Pseudoflavonifractor sp. 60]NBI67919.1 pyridoxal phosphate-dependent aminotransferase [Pseudoflavonifractor sp. 60]
MYNFDQIIDPSGTSRMKYGTPPEGAPADTIPMWIADMDFQTAPEVIDALKKRVEHGIFGYTSLPQSYRNAVVGWMDRRHNWKIQPEWIQVAPGIIPALKTAVTAFTDPGDGVLVQTPVYYMFMEIINLMGRQVVESPLVEQPDGYVMDLEDFERQIVDHHIKLFIFCNPHNPVNRVWTAEELRSLGEICKKHGVIVVSDEIHHDFIFKGYQFIPFAAADPSFADFCVTCTAPSKTFNCAGLKTSNTIISNPELRARYGKVAKEFGQTGIDPLSVCAVEAMYTYGDRWVDELVAYIWDNFCFLNQFLQDNMPQLRLTQPECLYLAWINVRGMNMNGDAFYQEALRQGVWIEDGGAFGASGANFVRMNLACPRSVLAEALSRLKKITSPEQ